DTLGCMARSLEDIALFRSVLLGVAHSPVAPLGRAPRIGFARTHLWEKAEASTRALIEDAATRLATNGAEVVDFTLPEAFADSETLHRRMTRLEVRNALAHERNTAWENISLSARGSIEEGDEVGFESFVRDLSGANALRMLFDEEMGDLDALITPSAPGEAPAGLSFTGATPFNYLWTLLHTPAVTIPSFTGSGGLPVGLQIVGRRWEDDRVLAVADWVRAQLD
ncbi:MAG: amidase, partial [Chromatiales bacterium]|nr:amidase [Chromatiales bacterium]